MNNYGQAIWDSILERKLHIFILGSHEISISVQSKAENKQNKKVQNNRLCRQQRSSAKEGGVMSVNFGFVYNCPKCEQNKMYKVFAFIRKPIII